MPWGYDQQNTLWRTNELISSRTTKQQGKKKTIMRGNLGIRDLRNICTGFLDPDLNQPYIKKKIL